MSSGWIRWILEKFEFPFEVVYPPKLDQGKLAGKYDVLIFADGLISGTEVRRATRRSDLADSENIPAEYRERLGSVTISNTIPQLRSFLEDGGAVVAIGGSTVLGYYLGLPIMNALTEKMANGAERPLPQEKFYVPGSILQVRVDHTQPLAYGLGETADVFFDNSPVFRLRPDAVLKGLRPVAWFDSKRSLRSGWAWGKPTSSRERLSSMSASERANSCCSGPKSPFGPSLMGLSSSSSTGSTMAGPIR